MRPIIGLLAEVDNELTTQVVHSYVRAIEGAGGTPIILPYVTDAEVIEHYAGLCDGFLFTGGVDVEPSRYGEETKPTCGEIQKYRDELEFALFERVLYTKKPIIAICRGAQLLNVALGGTLYQDIPSEIDTPISHRQSEPKFSPSHDVRVLEGTPLRELTSMERISANSFHHQALRGLGEGLRVMALADDGIIEAVYSTGEQYIRAYQWHPERICEINAQNKMIFEDFIGACRQGEA